MTSCINASIPRSTDIGPEKNTLKAKLVQIKASPVFPTVSATAFVATVIAALSLIYSGILTLRTNGSLKIDLLS